MSETEVVEEYDVLVHVDFDSRVDDECFENLKQFKLIGIETEEPILQLGDQVFKGAWKDTVGTHVFLEEEEEGPPEDLDIFSESSYSHVKYVCKTDKLLKMQRVFVSSNHKEAEAEGETDGAGANEPDILIPEPDISAPTPDTSTSQSDTPAPKSDTPSHKPDTPTPMSVDQE